LNIVANIRRIKEYPHEEVAHMEEHKERPVLILHRAWVVVRIFDHVVIHRTDIVSKILQKQDWLRPEVCEMLEIELLTERFLACVSDIVKEQNGIVHTGVTLNLADSETLPSIEELVSAARGVPTTVI
jgi:hypothetical protein